MKATFTDGYGWVQECAHLTLPWGNRYSHEGFQFQFKLSPFLKDEILGVLLKAQAECEALAARYPLAYNSPPPEAVTGYAKMIDKKFEESSH